MSKNRKRDLQVLVKILDCQNDIKSTLKKYKIQLSTDLPKQENIIRRGIVHAIGDIYEHTKSLTDETLKKLDLNQTYLRQFRNMASHQYNAISDKSAFTLISYIASKDITKRIKDEIEIIKEELNATAIKQ
ncbi:MAG: hypothetical protein FWC47_06125 [Oscillospiraceae bacterium]|nr:hypothetical protein [Oscillospiraceae bacterium]